MAPIIDVYNQRIEKIKRINHQDWKQKKTSQNGKSVGSARSKPRIMMSASDIGNPDVRVLLSNMCLSVAAGFLRILFSGFYVKTLTTNHDKNGNPVGTGIVVLSKQNAIRLIRQLQDVVIGSSDIQFKLIAASNIEKRVRFADKLDENESAGSKRTPSKLQDERIPQENKHEQLEPKRSCLYIRQFVYLTLFVLFMPCFSFNKTVKYFKCYFKLRLRISGFRW
ncbi:hypothetical protein CRE_10744 [Caenorhabditis remanei]|uniref:RRM domain-containing protein n=1 Tax=Caenorhabditis remanei TaxID=31234 RepID=E3NR12_CAERE|nr:hypothetical protein CRE_10744 [Caenorhabditis remanei]